MVTFVFPAPKQGMFNAIRWCMTDWAETHPLNFRPAIWVTPESDLHPTLRARLADKAVERAETGNDFYVITHSIEILLRLQALAGKRSLFRILAFTDISRFTEIPLEPDGRLVQEWPPETGLMTYMMALVCDSVKRK